MYDIQLDFHYNFFPTKQTIIAEKEIFFHMKAQNFKTRQLYRLFFTKKRLKRFFFQVDEICFEGQ